MKRNRILLSILWVGLVLLTFPSCNREEPDSPLQETTASVPVSFSLSVSDMENGTPETKAVKEPDIDNELNTEDQIINFAVLQFDQTTGTLVGNPEFIEDVDSYKASHQVNLKLSDDNEYKNPFVIVVVANIPGRNSLPSSQTTWDEYRKSYDSINSYDEIFTTADGIQYLRMSGYTVMEHIYKNSTITVNLKRNVAKLTINVVNLTAGDEKVTLQRAQLRDINGKYYYLTNTEDLAHAKNDYSPVNPCRFDKAQDMIPENNQFTYYVPINLRGTTNASDQYTKGLGAPKGATRFCLYGTYGSDDTPINYTYYLGENLTDDFNLEPNHHYTYNITLKTKGDPRFDYRVEDLAEVKFHVDANSYMLHPPVVQDQSRYYAVPIRRAAVFWNNPGENGGVYGANQFDGVDPYASIKIDGETEWTAEVLWSDFILDAANFLVKDSGKGYNPNDPNQDPYFRIRVTTGMKGNVVVAVKVGGYIVWSWHFWITDYNPDREDLTAVNGRYFYDVEGGKVHRYNNTIFNTTLPTETTYGYKYGFIMDRNLGALSPTFEDRRGPMYYQYGRKDPFMFYNQNGGTKPYMGGQVSTAYDYIRNYDTPEPDRRNVRYSVLHPTVYLQGDPKEGSDSKKTNNAWTGEDDLCTKAASTYWFDKKFFDHTGDQEILEIKKSIYDPCPPGWSVPPVNVFFQVTYENKYRENYSVVEGKENFYKTTAVTANGHIYYPYYNKVEDDNNTYYDKIKAQGGVFYPSNSYFSSNGRQETNVGLFGRLWTSSNIGETRSYLVELVSDDAVRTSCTHIYGLPVRCAREYGVVVK